MDIILLLSRYGCDNFIDLVFRQHPDIASILVCFGGHLPHFHIALRQSLLHDVFENCQADFGGIEQGKLLKHIIPNQLLSLTSCVETIIFTKSCAC